MAQHALVLLCLSSLPCIGIKSPAQQGRSDQIMTASIGGNVLLFSVICVMCAALPALGTMYL